jgi:hypothetical protein
MSRWSREIHDETIDGVADPGGSAAALGRSEGKDPAAADGRPVDDAARFALGRRASRSWRKRNRIPRARLTRIEQRADTSRCCQLLEALRPQTTTKKQVKP